MRSKTWPDFEGRCAPIPRDRFAPLPRIFAPPLKRHAPVLEKVSMIDQSQKLTSFGCLVSTLRKKVFFCKIEIVIATPGI